MPYLITELYDAFDQGCLHPAWECVKSLKLRLQRNRLLNI